MKTLMVLRHAKSSHADGNLDDFDRPLNERGLADAPRLGQRLLETENTPDMVLSSRARRAEQTAESVCLAAACSDRLKYRDTFYHGRPSDYVQEIRRVPASINKLMLVGHNPGLEHLLEWLTTKSERMPTAALAFVECPISDWDQLAADSNRLVEVWRPKEIFSDPMSPN